MSRVVVLGDVMVDVVARLSGPVAVGSDAPASISLGGGGSAANVAAWLAFAGARATLVARVGDDEFGALVRSQLAEDAHLATDPSLPTGTCIVLVAPGGERSMVPDPGANAALSPGMNTRVLIAQPPQPRQALHGCVATARRRAPA